MASEAAGSTEARPGGGQSKMSSPSPPWRAEAWMVLVNPCLKAGFPTTWLTGRAGKTTICNGGLRQERGERRVGERKVSSTPRCQVLQGAPPHPGHWALSQLRQVGVNGRDARWGLGAAFRELRMTWAAGLEVHATSLLLSVPASGMPSTCRAF